MRWTDILLCKDKRKIKGIYYESFPSKERIPWAMMLGDDASPFCDSLIFSGTEFWVPII